jgi:predicted metalloprotease with PDZ domain
VVTSADSLRGANFDQIGTISHEFTHAWNVERIRPRELEPFDFSRANPTPSLWLAEGFTNYYGPLLLHRAGLTSSDRFLADTSVALSRVVNAPARAGGSPQEMSLRAPFVDAATAIDPVNPNIFVSYYTYGQVIALALDLTLRQRFSGVTLDDLMRDLWRAHGQPERPYTPADVETALARVTGDAAFARSFFATTVEGSALPDFVPLLAQAGLSIRRARPGAAWLGVRDVTAADGLVTLAQSPITGSPLYVAGVDRGDRLVAIGEVAIGSGSDLAAATGRLTPGARVPLRFVQGGRELTATLTVAADPALAIVALDRPTAAQLRFRTAWLGKDTAGPR